MTAKIRSVRNTLIGGIMCMTGLLAIVAIPGCSVLETVAEDRNQLAVQYATLKVIDGESQKADRIVELVEKARAYVGEGSTVTISYLADEAAIRLRQSGLDPADMILATAILERAEARLKSEIGDGVLNDQQRVQLLTVLNWIEDAARGYVQP